MSEEKVKRGWDYKGHGISVWEGPMMTRQERYEACLHLKEKIPPGELRTFLGLDNILPPDKDEDYSI